MLAACHTERAIAAATPNAGARADRTVAIHWATLTRFGCLLLASRCNVWVQFILSPVQPIRPIYISNHQPVASQLVVQLSRRQRRVSAYYSKTQFANKRPSKGDNRSALLSKRIYFLINFVDIKYLNLELRSWRMSSPTGPVIAKYCYIDTRQRQFVRAC